MLKGNDEDIKIIIGDDSNLQFSDVGDIINTLRPKENKKLNKKVIIPKTKSQKEKEKQK